MFVTFLVCSNVLKWGLIKIDNHFHKVDQKLVDHNEEF